MPFPLAHPAAALPFRRWCPQYLSFEALVIGSLIPDLANCLSWDNFTHSVVGGFAFCLPVGMLSLLVFHSVRAPLTASLPKPHREVLLPLCNAPCSSFFISLVSLLLGSWIHIGWDMFTHDHSALAQRMGSVSVTLPHLASYQLRISRVLWVASDLGGMALVVAAYRSWLKRANRPLFIFSRSEREAYARWCVILVTPLAVATFLDLLVYPGHYQFGFLVRTIAELYLACLYLTLAIAGLFLQRRATGQK